ncbi:unnamed protein product [Darwinula stevensoni]|uniref:Basic leucine zipper domain-containing protein n=1 Tax=Darwinula stevensoni TaxID=69355 RepID=A0A7R8WXU6_9CRUS|nr:unnamed protein product [Darwinula stevensoni]CAG0878713.1 unnamed protein product [Darwinula stevensoni]
MESPTNLLQPFFSFNPEEKPKVEEFPPCGEDLPSVNHCQGLNSSNSPQSSRISPHDPFWTMDSGFHACPVPIQYLNSQMTPGHEEYQDRSGWDCVDPNFVDVPEGPPPPLPVPCAVDGFDVPFQGDYGFYEESGDADGDSGTGTWDMDCWTEANCCNGTNGIKEEMYGEERKLLNYPVMEEMPSKCETASVSASSPMGSSLDDDELLTLPVREFNRRMQGMPQPKVQIYKQKRRTLKNRKYAQICRTKKVQLSQELKMQNTELKKKLDEKEYLLNNAARKVDSLEKELNACKHERDTLRLENDALKQERDVSRQENDAYKKKLQELLVSGRG